MLAEQNQEGLIAKIFKSREEEIRVVLSEYNGVDRLDIRVYYLADPVDQVYKPTKKGINIRLDAWPNFLKLVNDTNAELEKQGDIG